MRIRFGGAAAAISLTIGAVAMLWTPIAASIAFGRVALVISPLTLFGGVFVLGGLLLLRGSTYVTVEDDRFIVHALVGPMRRTFEVASWQDVALRGGKLNVAGRALPISRAQANPHDWRVLERFVAERRAAASSATSSGG